MLKMLRASGSAFLHYARKVIPPEPGFQPDQPKRGLPKGTYPVGVAGESFRQAAVRKCRIGDCVDFELEPDNPFDPDAVAVYVRGEQIGYLPRDGWVTRVLIDQDGSVTATVLSVGRGNASDLGVVLAVSRA